MRTAFFVLIGLILLSFNASAQQDINKMSWTKVALRMPENWYSGEEAAKVAENVLACQTKLGGWPKNMPFHKGINEKEMEHIRKTGIGATIDNGATTTEMRFLAKMYNSTKDDKYKKAFLKGFSYILAAQYANGGWPQFYPARGTGGVSYSSHITYNDGAYINVMKVLQDMFTDSPAFASLALSEKVKNDAKKSFDKGIDCILKTDIVVNGQPTVWCAQHDEVTFAPAKARAYELPSFSGAESVGVVELLMSLPNPSKEIVAAVKGAVKWFDEHKIENVKFARYIDDKGEKNAGLQASKGDVLWARFYDLETEKPFFSDRDGIKKSSLSEIGQERRGGYSWYTTGPAQVLKKYPEWLKSNGL